MRQQLEQLKSHANESGLTITAVTPLTRQDGFDDKYKSIALLSHDPSRFWPIFSKSQQSNDGLPDPIDRWSKKTISDIANNVEGFAVFPFDASPYHPFSTWAQRAGVAWQSPAGLLVHADYGLWISFRGAVAIEILSDKRMGLKSPCETCQRPCLQACPVNALSTGAFDYQTCLSHVRAVEGVDCANFGCIARRACPVGQHFAPPPQQVRVHMKSFARELIE